ncbi:MAG TPA: Ig-like domain-containing protein [Candidatus Saccharimonadales bacterium]|nr:Ig-like domain-containing protein [Candidatus Saccharimonadales bacterium]
MPTKKTSKKAKPTPRLLKSTAKYNKPAAGLLAAVLAVAGVIMIFRSQAAAPPPPAGGYFATLQPGSALPSEAECAQRVTRSAWEPRPENYAANQTVPASVSLPGFTPNDGGVDSRARALADRVSGNFTGTTDEIIQWASCKWGFNDDTLRAIAVTESTWRQSALGDYTSDQSRCQQGYTAPCPESFGLTQIKARFHRGTFPSSRDATAFNVDYAMMTHRVCYEGWTNWLKPNNPTYQAGDDWGCWGHHYSGGWNDSGALNYIKTAQGHYQNKPWRGWADKSGDTPSDTTPPGIPANVTAAAKSSSRIDLTWTASQDNTGVTGYDIFRNNAKVATVATTSYSDSNLAAATAYTYFVTARDAAGNSSPASTSVSATTQPASTTTADTTAPVVSITAPSNGAQIGRSTKVTATATDSSAITKMQVYIDGSLKDTDEGSSLVYDWNSKRASRGQHTITVKAYDAAGNAGQSSVTLYK